MRSTSGAGVLVARGRQIHILYDLVQQEGAENAAVVGQIFGDADALYQAFHASRSTLRLANGHTASIVLQNCEARGAADVRIVGPMAWD